MIRDTEPQRAATEAGFSQEEIVRQQALDRALREIVMDQELLAAIQAHGREGTGLGNLGQRELPLLEQEIRRTLRRPITIPSLSIGGDGAVQIHRWYEGAETVVSAQLLPIVNGAVSLGEGRSLLVPQDDLTKYGHLIDPTDQTAFVITNGGLLPGRAEGKLFGGYYPSAFKTITPAILGERVAATRKRLVSTKAP